MDGGRDLSSGQRQLYSGVVQRVGVAFQGPNCFETGVDGVMEGNPASHKATSGML